MAQENQDEIVIKASLKSVWLQSATFAASMFVASIVTDAVLDGKFRPLRDGAIVAIIGLLFLSLSLVQRSRLIISELGVRYHNGLWSSQVPWEEIMSILLGRRNKLALYKTIQLYVKPGKAERTSLPYLPQIIQAVEHFGHGELLDETILRNQA